jgi:hypothetical protein
MKTISLTQENNLALEMATTQDVNSVKASHALVTNVELENGKKSSIVTLFNNSEFSFEEINVGVNTSLENHDWLKISKIKASLHLLKNGRLEYLHSFEDIKRKAIA